MKTLAIKSLAIAFHALGNVERMIERSRLYLWQSIVHNCETEQSIILLKEPETGTELEVDILC